MKRFILCGLAIVLGLLLAAVSATSARADGNTVTIRVVDSQDHPLVGVEVKATKPNVGGFTLGLTGSDGNVTASLPWNGGITFTARYAYSSASMALNVAAAGNVAPLHTFRTTPAVIKVTDSAGTALAGAEVRYTVVNSGGEVMGTTTAENAGIVSTELFPGAYTFTARFNYSSSKVENINITAGTPVDYTFKTTKAVIAVKDCAGKVVDGTPVTYTIVNSGGGPVGTATNANAGIVSIELFPGTYRFTAVANKTYANVDVAITAGNLGGTVNYIFKPTLVTFTNDFGAVNMTQTNIGTTVFNGPTYIFPGTYTINFYQGSTKLYSVPMTISGCTLDKSFVRVDARNSTKAPLAGVEISAFKPNVGGATLGTTDSTGSVYGLLPWTGNNIVLTARYAKSSASATVSVPGTPNVPLFIFETTPATIAVKDSLGIPLPGAEVTYFVPNSGGGNVGTTTANNLGVVSTELFPGAYTFTARYAKSSASAASVSINGGGVDYTFATTPAVIRVEDSNHAPLAGASVSYFVSNSGGGSLNPTAEVGVFSTELFAGTYSFTARYKYSSATGNVDISSQSGTTADGTFTTTPAVIRVQDSGLNALSGASVSYFVSNSGGGSLNPTAEVGVFSVELFPGTYSFTARYKYSSASANVNIETASGTGVDGIFTTTPAIIAVKDCAGNPVDGASVSYFITNSGGGAVGPTAAVGVFSTELFAGTYRFTTTINRTSSVANVEIAPVGKLPTDTDAVFTPATVQFFYSAGRVSMWQNNIGSTVFSGPTYIFPGSYTIDFYQGNSTKLYSLPMTVEGCGFAKAVNVLRVKDSNGSPIAGARARGGYGTNFGTWFVSGATDANGILVDMRDMASQPTTMSYELGFNNTTAVKTQDVSANALFDFQTVLLTLRVQSSAEAPQNGVNIRYGTGSTYTSWWYPGGATGSGTNAPGETKAQVFPGTYSFEAQWRATADTRLNVSVPDTGSTVTWTTTTVTIQNFAGDISYGGTGDSTWFTKPSMDLLPGTYWFHFRGGETRQITFGGNEYTYTY